MLGKEKATSVQLGARAKCSVGALMLEAHGVCPWLRLTWRSLSRHAVVHFEYYSHPVGRAWLDTEKSGLSQSSRLFQVTTSGHISSSHKLSQVGGVRAIVPSITYLLALKRRMFITCKLYMRLSRGISL